MCVNGTETTSEAYKNCTIEKQCSSEYLNTMEPNIWSITSLICTFLICWALMPSTIYIWLYKCVSKPFASSLNLWYDIKMHSVIVHSVTAVASRNLTYLSRQVCLPTYCLGFLGWNFLLGIALPIWKYFKDVKELLNLFRRVSFILNKTCFMCWITASSEM